MTYDIIQKMVPECKPEWKEKAIMVFPGLRRLQAIPLLQTSLICRQGKLKFSIFGSKPQS